MHRELVPVFSVPSFKEILHFIFNIKTISMQQYWTYQNCRVACSLERQEVQGQQLGEIQICQETTLPDFFRTLLRETRYLASPVSGRLFSFNCTGTDPLRSPSIQFPSAGCIKFTVSAQRLPGGSLHICRLAV